MTRQLTQTPDPVLKGTLNQLQLGGVLAIFVSNAKVATGIFTSFRLTGRVNFVYFTGDS
jgi:hypothetical protein